MVDSISENQLENQVLERLQQLGFNVIGKKAFFKSSHARPDFIVERAEKRVALEVKARPVMLSDISRVSRYKQPGIVGTILCTQDYFLTKTPESVRSYAEQLDIQLCSTDALGEVLQSILG